MYWKCLLSFAGGVQELVLEFDVHLNFELANMARKLMFDLKRLSIFSQFLRQGSGNEFQIPHFYSDTSNNMSTSLESGECASEHQHRDVIHPLSDPSCSRDSESPEISAKDYIPEVSNLSSQKYILKHLDAFFSVQKPVNGPLCLHQSWAGSGSISGFDMMISLSEMEVSFWWKNKLI